MKQAVTVILGAVLIYAGFSRQDIFYRIRGVPIKGFGAIFMRLIYIVLGILLIIL